LLRAVICNLGAAHVLLGADRCFLDGLCWTSTTTSPSRLLVLEVAHVDASCVAAFHLAETVGMRLQLVGLEINLVFKDDEFLLETFTVGAEVVLLLEVDFKGVVVQVILWGDVRGAGSFTYVTTLVLVAAVLPQFVPRIETLVAESTFRVALEPTLVVTAGNIVSVLFVASQFGRREELVFMREDFLVASTQVTAAAGMSECFPEEKQFLVITHHITRLCTALTCRWRPGHPRPA
jgi:hypothetical protein